jgi:hypothetical protein
VYEDFTPWPKPTDDTDIWRYIDFTKLVSMLEGKALYFCRSGLLGDPFEGMYTKMKPPIEFPRTGNPKMDEELEAIKPELIRKRHEAMKRVRETFYVNCWHANQYESAAMWKLYLRTNEGVAIRSTFGRAKEGVGTDGPVVYGSSVAYLDYDRDVIPGHNLLCPFMCKRASFAHEQEVRFWLWDGDEFANRITAADDPSVPGIPLRAGVNVPVDLDKLVEAVYVAPTSPVWFYELVKAVLAKYGLRKEVINSSLDDDPVL